MRLFKGLLIFIFFISCATNQPPLLDVNKVYRKDMIATVNGKSFEGIGAIPEADEYNFEVEARGDLELFTMSSCEGALPKEAAWNVQTRINSFPWFGSRKIDDKRKVKFTYKKSQMAKEVGYCPIVLEGLDSNKGKHSWAFFDFLDSRINLANYTECNFETKRNDGIYACQTLEGSDIKIRFDNMVRVLFPTEHNSFCSNKENKCICDGNKCLAEEKSFMWRVPLGINEYRFVEIGTGKEARLTTFGFNDIPIRK